MADHLIPSVEPGASGPAGDAFTVNIPTDRQFVDGAGWLVAGLRFTTVIGKRIKGVRFFLTSDMVINEAILDSKFRVVLMKGTTDSYLVATTTEYRSPSDYGLNGVTAPYGAFVEYDFDTPYVVDSTGEYQACVQFAPQRYPAVSTPQWDFVADGDVTLVGGAYNYQISDDEGFNIYWKHTWLSPDASKGLSGFWFGVDVVTTDPVIGNPSDFESNMQVGSTQVSKVLVGDQEVDKIYIGSDLIYRKE